MQIRIGTSIRICILSFLIGDLLAFQARSVRPIFNTCLDRELGKVLKYITVHLHHQRKKAPITEIEANEKVKNIMRMISQYMNNDIVVQARKSNESRRFFLWPLIDWTQLTSIEGHVGGMVRGKLSTEGFKLGGGLTGGLQGSYAEEHSEEETSHEHDEDTRPEDDEESEEDEGHDYDWHFR